MFRRRNKETLGKKIKGFLWPSIGWQRLGRYFALRLQRMPGTPYSIASGFACGVAISFTPFVGFHCALAALFAWGIRSSIIAALIGTLIGNPWTFPFIWWGILKAGHFMMGHDATNVDVNFIRLFQSLTKTVLSGDMKAFTREVWPVWYMMFIGSIPFFVISWVGSYFPIKYMVVKLRYLRSLRIQERFKQRLVEGFSKNNIKRFFSKFRLKGRKNKKYAKKYFLNNKRAKHSSGNSIINRASRKDKRLLRNYYNRFKTKRDDSRALKRLRQEIRKHRRIRQCKQR